MERLQKMNKEKFIHDTIVIGAGLAGLSSALFLQKNNKNVLLIESKPHVGGLCSNTFLDGYEFAIGCNDFGQGLVKQLEELQIPIQWKKSKIQIHFEDKVLTFPPNAKTFVKLVPHLSDIARFGRYLWKNKNNQIKFKTLGEVVTSSVRTDKTKDLLNFFSIPTGITPQECLLETFTHDKIYSYGYSQTVYPEEGPQGLADKMLKAFLKKGKAQLNTRVLNISKKNDVTNVETDRGIFFAKNVISTIQRKDETKNIKLKDGLFLAAFFLATKKDLQLPDVHALTYCPPNVDEWFSKLDKGIPSENFSFNMVINSLPNAKAYHSFTTFFVCPRDLDKFDENYRNSIQSIILSQIERMIPGFQDNLIYKKLMDPCEYRTQFGLSSQLMPYIPVPGYKSAPNLDKESGIYYAGRLVYPPGDHAGAAFLSGKLVAEMISKNT